MKLLTFQVLSVVFLIQFIENVENSQLFTNCGKTYHNSGVGYSFGGNESENGEAPW